MKKQLCIIFLILSFICFSIFCLLIENSKEYTVTEIISPIEFILDGKTTYKLDNVDTFDSNYTERNKQLAESLKLTEDEAFILGAQAEDWAKNILLQRKVSIIDNSLIYYKFKYLTKFKNSPFCLENGHPTNPTAFEKQLNSIRNGKFVILNLEDDSSYPVSKSNRNKIDKFVVIRKGQAYHKNLSKKELFHRKDTSQPLLKASFGNIEIILSDMTTKIKPDRNCSSEICKKIVSKINSSNKTIDMAIYGYSSTPAIENAIINAKKRGVNIRLIYDIDKNGENIYPDTQKFVKLVPNSKNDSNSKEVGSTMHNKFYIFDKETVITGSANLSHTDMSGFNSNAIVVIQSQEIAKYYTQEFEQMYNGKFHNDKIAQPNKAAENIQIYFSPQDKTISAIILPLIRNAKNYIYIPSFVITEKRVAEELINAHRRGVDIKIILDALNASNKSSKETLLRNAGIQLKAENWAGKMHSKSMIIDDSYVVIGSMNFSNSGDSKNDENLIVLQNSQAAKFYKSFFLYQWEKIPSIWLKYNPRAEGWDSIGSCEDGIDNNYDGLTDSADTACQSKSKN